MSCENAPNRSNFGPGVAGEKAWSMIESGVTCEAIIDGKPCGKPAIGTTDYDIIGDLEQRPHCSQEHHNLIVEAVRSESTAIGRRTTSGYNGFGRA